MFLGPSDTDIAAATIARLSEPKGARGSLGAGRKPTIPQKHKFSSEARKSLAVLQRKMSSAVDAMPDDQGVDEGSPRLSEGSNEEDEEEEEGEGMNLHFALNYETKHIYVNFVDGNPKDEQMRVVDDDNDDWDMDDDQAPAAADDADEDPMMVFRVSDVDYDINEISKGLELLLEGYRNLQMVSVSLALLH